MLLSMYDACVYDITEYFHEPRGPMHLTPLLIISTIKADNLRYLLTNGHTTEGQQDILPVQTTQ